MWHGLCCSIPVTSDSLATTETVAHQGPLSMGFPWHKYWNGLPFPSPGNLPDPRIEAGSPALASGFFTTEPPGRSRDMDSTAQFRKLPGNSEVPRLCCVTLDKFLGLSKPLL